MAKAKVKAKSKSNSSGDKGSDKGNKAGQGSKSSSPKNKNTGAKEKVSSRKAAEARSGQESSGEKGRGGSRKASVRKPSGSKASVRKAPRSKLNVAKEQIKDVNDEHQMPLSQRNYFWFILGFGLIVLGFILMATEDFIDATQFSLALYVCPVLIIAGHAIIIYGLIIKPSNAIDESAAENSNADPGIES